MHHINKAKAAGYDQDEIVNGVSEQWFLVSHLETS